MDELSSCALVTADNEPLLNDIEQAVEEASYTVSVSGLEDIDIIEDDVSRDMEERQITRFLSRGCGCKLNDGSGCHTLFSESQLRVLRDECMGLSRDEMDMVVMGQLRALCQRDPITQKTKAKNAERKRTTTLFRFGGHRICQKTFLFIHHLSNTRFEAIKRSWLQNGLCPRLRRSAAPHNRTRLSDIQHIVRFILQYAEEHAILLPGRIPGYKQDDVQLLPSSTTKREVWQTYCLAAEGSDDIKAVCYSLFCSLWKQLTPQVIVTKPMSDLCWTCQQNSALILRANNRPVEEKSEVKYTIKQKSKKTCMQATRVSYSKGGICPLT